MLKKLSREEIQKIVQTGYNFSQAMQEDSRISLKGYIPFTFNLRSVIALEHARLLVYENIADLNQVGLARENQRSWTLRDWEIAIRQATGQPDPVIATLTSDDELRLHWHNLSVKATEDGGWNLKEGCWTIKYYRRRKAAIKAGLKRAGF